MRRKSRMEMSKTLKTLETVLLLLLILLLLYANLAYYLWKQITIAVVEGYSMYPLLHDGDIVLIIPSDNIHLGDIIIFRNDYNEFVIHRVIGIINCSGKNLYMTKGDNNQFVDQATFISYRTSIECRKGTIEILHGVNNVFVENILQAIDDSYRGIDVSRVVGKVLQINGVVIKITGLITR
ncbi:MAG: signal peptidase I [Ignisphaera sp.]